MLRREHQFRANLGRIYSFSRGLRMDDNGDFRRPDVLACEAYARQTLDNIVTSPDDPFGYRLLDLWLDVFQRPWDQPTDLDELLADLAEKIGSGELKGYLEYDPNWEALGSMAFGGSKSSTAIGNEDGDTEEQRTQDLPYTPDPDYTVPKAGDRIHRRKHPDGPKVDPRTIQSDGKPLGAKEGQMPAEFAGMEEPPPNHDVLVEEGWPTLTYKGNTTYDTFTDAKPVELPPGTEIYRIVDERAGNDGGFWAYEIPESKAAWRSDYAVKDDWNDNGYYVKHVVGKEGLKAWEGKASGQRYRKHDGKKFYLKGGETQLFITPGDTNPSAPELTNWPEP